MRTISVKCGRTGDQAKMQVSRKMRESWHLCRSVIFAAKYQMSPGVGTPYSSMSGNSSYFLGVGIGDPVFFRGFLGQNLSFENTWYFLGVILALIRIPSQL